MAKEEFLIVLFGIVFSAAEYSSKCLNPEPIANMNEENCVNTKWYRVGGNIPCENCCITRTLTYKGPRHALATDITIQNKLKTVDNFLFITDKTGFIYRRVDGSKSYIMLDTDCKTYSVLYEPKMNELQVFLTTRAFNRSFINSLAGVKKCNLPVYDYNTLNACQNVVL